jgi:hypothetical protein
MSDKSNAWTPHQVRGDGVFVDEFIPQIGNFDQIQAQKKPDKVQRTAKGNHFAPIQIL